jgi:putative FmdB family regulatory protein
MAPGEPRIGQMAAVYRHRSRVERRSGVCAEVLVGDRYTRPAMPTYEYVCKSCGHIFEIVQSMKDEALTECPECGGELRKVFAPPAIAFKGSGFYATDHGKKSKQPASGKKDSGESGSEGKGSSEKGGSGGESKSDKPAEKPGEKKAESKPAASGSGSGNGAGSGGSS